MYRVIRSDIYRTKSGELDVDYYSQNHGGITTHRGKGKDVVHPGKPYVTDDSFLNGHVVYSVYPFTGDDYVSIFKDIKQGKLDKELYDEWLDYTAEYIWSEILNSNKPDIIAVPQSSSSLVEDLAKQISRMAHIDYIPHAFHKNPVDKITITIPQGIKIPQSTIDAMNKILDRIRQEGRFEAKSVPKRMLKFFRNIYTNDEEYKDELRGKKVAVLDDSMSSKATMANIFDVCDYVYNVASSYGVTIFKKVGSHR